ncbi:MAG: outer membrane beta-barrel protein [Bacteroidales bacterium]
MKKHVLTLAILLSFTLNSLAQKTNYLSLYSDDKIQYNTGADTIKPKKDTTEINFKNKKIRISEDEDGTKIDVKRKDEESYKSWGEEDEDEFNFVFSKSGKNFDAHWAGFEFGLNNFMNPHYNIKPADGLDFMELNTGKSWNINLNILEYDHALIGENFGIATGLGFEFNDYRFSNLLPIKKSDGEIITDQSYDTENIIVEKAKLSTTYITIPLILEWQTPITKKDDKLFISGGLIGGIKIGSHTKIKYKDHNGDMKKDKNRNDFYLSPYRYGYTIRAGVGFVKLYANYYATPMFEKNKAPEMHPFAAGFMFSF